MLTVVPAEIEHTFKFSDHDRDNQCCLCGERSDTLTPIGGERALFIWYKYEVLLHPEADQICTDDPNRCSEKALCALSILTTYIRENSVSNDDTNRIVHNLVGIVKAPAFNRMLKEHLAQDNMKTLHSECQLNDEGVESALIKDIYSGIHRHFSECEDFVDRLLKTGYRPSSDSQDEYVMQQTEPSHRKRCSACAAILLNRWKDILPQFLDIIFEGNEQGMSYRGTDRMWYCTTLKAFHMMQFYVYLMEDIRTASALLTDPDHCQGLLLSILACCQSLVMCIPDERNNDLVAEARGLECPWALRGIFPSNEHSNDKMHQMLDDNFHIFLTSLLMRLAKPGNTLNELRNQYQNLPRDVSLEIIKFMKRLLNRKLHWDPYLHFQYNVNPLSGVLTRHQLNERSICMKLRMLASIVCDEVIGEIECDGRKLYLYGNYSRIWLKNDYSDKLMGWNDIECQRSGCAKTKRDAKKCKEDWYQCSRCKYARYCSKHCQKVDWNTGSHKKLCALMSL